MVDSFDHTKNEFHDDTHDSIADIDVRNDDIDIFHHQETKAVLRKRMESAYSRAGSMMLVSSVTTAICFFSNAFGVLTVVQEFGIFMGYVFFSLFSIHDFNRTLSSPYSLSLFLSLFNKVWSCWSTTCMS